MAKRELSSTLRNLKFMQRAAAREEKPKKEGEAKANGDFLSSASVRKKCVVIMEGDPHPGAVIGRMSFQCFNPSIDKMNEEAVNPRQPDAPVTSSGTQSEGSSFRDNRSAMNGEEPVSFDEQNSEGNGDLKRKQTEVVAGTPYPSKLPRTMQSDTQQSSPAGSRSSRKQPKREKLDWNILRPSKGQLEK
ncbi:uncharacterized protein LOC115746066 isoform X1 [Rhodamnia argentea]|uniref:Uncharacterized protein LOC115746066 isoform X1 n=1 Tax=Rhodamnia argentea TaxID=178133 RepID=A0A8B8PTI6_9MYRT|nr:uncharacterized protein LOC115746066 isoform X1 [Rhodamnia argentea]